MLQQVQVQVQVLPALYSDNAEAATKSSSCELNISIFKVLFILLPLWLKIDF
jgi:hypothetical protein